MNDDGRESTRPAPAVSASAHEQSLDMPPTGNAQVKSYHAVQPHSAALGVVASFFIPGLGSMINERVGKGIGIFLCYLVSIALCFAVIGLITLPAVVIWGCVAGSNDAHRWNRAHGIMS